MRHLPVAACCCHKPHTHTSAALSSKTWRIPIMNTVGKSLCHRMEVSIAGPVVVSAPLVQASRGASHPSPSSVCQFSNVSQAAVRPLKGHHWYNDTSREKQINAWRPVRTQQTIRGTISISQTNHVARNAKRTENKLDTKCLWFHISAQLHRHEHDHVGNHTL